MKKTHSSIIQVVMIYNEKILNGHWCKNLLASNLFKGIRKKGIFWVGHKAKKSYSPGTLAACCKPSSGAGVVWMDTLLIGLGLSPGHKNGDRVKESYQSATLPGRWISRKRTQDRRVACYKMWSAKLRVRAPPPTKFFWPFFFDCDNVLLCTCAYSVLGVHNSHCNSGSLLGWLIVLVISLQK